MVFHRITKCHKAIENGKMNEISHFVQGLRLAYAHPRQGIQDTAVGSIVGPEERPRKWEVSYTI